MPISGIGTDTAVEYSTHTYKMCADAARQMTYLYVCMHMTILLVLCLYCSENCSTLKYILRIVV